MRQASKKQGTPLVGVVVNERKGSSLVYMKNNSQAGSTQLGVPLATGNSKMGVVIHRQAADQNGYRDEYKKH